MLPGLYIWFPFRRTYFDERNTLEHAYDHAELRPALNQPPWAQNAPETLVFFS